MVASRLFRKHHYVVSTKEKLWKQSLELMIQELTEPVPPIEWTKLRSIKSLASSYF